MLTYAASGPADFRGKIRGFIAEGPLIALHPKVEPFKATALAGRAAASLLPNFQLNQQLPPQLICRDPLVVAEYTADPLCHNLGTLVGLRDMLARARDLREDRVKVPEEARVLVLHGGSDSITSAVASEKWVERCKARGMGNVMWKGYPGAYHQLHREPHGVKEQFVEDVGDWILANVA